MPYSSLLSGRLIARNTIYNLLGAGIPLTVAFIAVPMIIRGLGIERFGVLTLAWMVVGYFGLFDLGIGRATTKFVSEACARREENVLPQLVWTSIGMLFCFGLLGGLLFAALNSLIVFRFFIISAYLNDETLKAFYLLAASIPFVLGTAGTRGVLEAQQRFGLINAIKIPVSTASFAAPLFVLPYSNSLYHITAVLLAIRLVEFSAYFFYCLRTIPGMKRPRWPHMVSVKKMMGFGGWLTVTNIVGPLMTYMDRFIIGGLLSMSVVAYYTAPYDFVTRLAVIPGSLVSVVFPALTASFAVNAERFVTLYDQAMKYILLAMTPFVIILILIANPFLRMWLGPEFSVQSTLVFQILSCGILFNSIAQIPFCAIQAMGRPDITAKIHVIELPFYLGLVWILVLKMGIVGAALAGLIRITADFTVLYLITSRMLPEGAHRRRR